MQFRVLGSLAAVSNGAVAELGPPKQRALLAILLLHVGEIVPVDRLIDLLWGEDAPRTAAHSIQIYVSELRRGLEPVGGGRAIVTRTPGYVLAANRDSIDAWQFERLAREGARLLEEGDTVRGRATLREALALWHGPVLADFAYEEFAQPHIRRLNDAHLDAVEILAAAELDAGRTAEAMALLSAAVEDDPLREHTRELLMLALYRSGRHADALRTFEALRTALGEELGIDPSPRLRALYDRILLHDPSLLPEARRSPPSDQPRNPYKGLRAFAEADAPDFFGRDRLVGQLVDRLAAGSRLVSLVGPSGSGKSSVVAAGLVPRLRNGALPGSERWRVVRLVPGAKPDAEWDALVGTQPDLVVIDQFEQVFTTSGEEARDAFLRDLAGAIADGARTLRVILTLRADYYDRPLLHPAFAPLFTPSVVNVLPMAAEELELAVVEPARRVGVEVEPALLAELVVDMAAQPGSLPLLQYALTELFERRSGETLTRAGFAGLGGLRGLLSRDAEQLFRGLGDGAQAAAMQIFLRLVHAGSGTAESRRRVALAELSDLGIDPVVLSEVLTTFGNRRLLTFDRHPVSGHATVEVAHEALLVEWERLAGWLDRHRADLRRHAALISAAEEWEQSGRNPDYLFAGSRLREYEPWLARSAMQLSGRERAFLEAAAEHLDAQRQRERDARRRFIALAAVVFVLAGALSFALLVGIGPERPAVALLTSKSVVDELMEVGFDAGVADFELGSRKVEIQDRSEFEAALRDLSRGRPALVVVAPTEEVGAIVQDYPDTHYLLFSWTPALPNVTTIDFREGQGAFLAGVAAARTTRSGIVGFIGGLDFTPIWRFQAGYVAGARHANSTIEVLTTYLEEVDESGRWTGIGFRDAAAAEDAARAMYRRGADVIFQAAGEAGLGVFDAAASWPDAGERDHWVIGVDSDQYETVARLPGVTSAQAWRGHILTSMLKRFDLVIYNALRDVAAGSRPAPFQVFDLESGMIDISYSGGFIDALRPEIDEYRRQIISGEIEVPCIPDDRLFLIDEWAEADGITPQEVLDVLCP